MTTHLLQGREQPDKEPAPPVSLAQDQLLLHGLVLRGHFRQRLAGFRCEALGGLFQQGTQAVWQILQQPAQGVM